MPGGSVPTGHLVEPGDLSARPLSTLSVVDYVGHLRRESGLFRAALAQAPPDGRVPGCPGWLASDLLWHLSEVQWFWGTVVESQLTRPDEAHRSALERREDFSAALDLFDEASHRLVRALETTPPETPMWTWHEADQSAAFICRRQAHEALVHRVDAEQSAGKAITPVDAALASDGVDELVSVMIAGIPQWATFEPDGVTLELVARHRGRWRLDFGRMTGTSPETGNTYDLDAAELSTGDSDADTELTGDALDLDLWLWGRGSVDSLDIEGDIATVDRLRLLTSEATQ